MPETVLDTKFTPQSLLPKYWDIAVNSFDDIVALGDSTVRQIQQSMQNGVHNSERYAQKLKDLLAEIGHLSPDTIVAEAAKYENPTNMRKAVPKDSWSNDEEPVDAASIARTAGATTFNICGWCKHCGGGTCRYSYHITTTCSLLTESGQEAPSRRFDSPCFLQSATADEFRKIRDGIALKVLTVTEDKKVYEEKAALLGLLLARTEQKPSGPSHRPADWADVGDKVVVYIGDWKSSDNSLLVNKKFAAGKVIPGYRHGDGCVSVCFDEKIHSGDYLDGHGSGYGVCRPEVMLDWEFDYLRKHPDFARMYATTLADRVRDFSAENFLAALAAYSD